MVMMQADQDFTGPRGAVKQGDVVDVSPKVAARWVETGLAHPYDAGAEANLNLQTQQAVIDEQPSVTAKSEPVVAGNLEAKEAADEAKDEADQAKVEESTEVTDEPKAAASKGKKS